jgi:hypothetical protein
VLDQQKFDSINSSLLAQSMIIINQVIYKIISNQIDYANISFHLNETPPKYMAIKLMGE